VGAIAFANCVAVYATCFWQAFEEFSDEYDGDRSKVPG
jgi:hypothetical protein